MFNARQVLISLTLRSLHPGRGRLTTNKSNNTSGGDKSHGGKLSWRRRIKNAGSGVGLLSVRYFENTHLILMFSCSNSLKPPHYLQHQDHTSQPDRPDSAWCAPCQTLHSQLLQRLQTHSSVGHI